MKRLITRWIALTLAAALLCGLGPQTALARPARPDPACALGTEPSDMLAAGGRRVQAGERIYYVDDADGCVYDLDRPDAPVLQGPAAKLNYADGQLYYARPGAERFDLCVFDLEAGTETVLLRGFAGSPGQLWLVDGDRLVFSADEAVWQLPLQGGEPELLLRAEGLWSFVPTGCGLIYALGSLFDCDLYADGRLVARHVSDYTLRRDIGEGLLVYTQDGRCLQQELAGVFAGDAVPGAFAGAPAAETDPVALPLTEAEALRAEQAEAERLQAELADILALPENRGPSAAPAAAPPSAATLDANDPELPADLQPGDWAETVDFVESPAAPTAVFSGEALRAPLSTGQQNIVKRCRQMLNIKWTPRKGVGGWGYYDSSYNLRIYYQAGVTYTGLPYGQCVKGSYVPWSTSLTQFINAVNDPNSKMYTTRNTYSRGSQYYGTDCSGFASWAWQTNSRKVCTTMWTSDVSYKVSRSYTDSQVGDCYISSYHVVVVTDITYNWDGSIGSIELSEANPTTGHNGCSYTTRYTGTAALQRMQKTYLNGSYSIYRRNADALSAITYTHECVVPLEGDVCPICGAGMDTPPVDTDVVRGVAVNQNAGTVSWSAAAREVDFALLRIGYTDTKGSYVMDSQFINNVSGCLDNGIPYGLYYYGAATTLDQAILEADAVLGFLLEGGALPSLPVFYYLDQNSPALAGSASTLGAAVNAFCAHFGDYGLGAGILADVSIWNARLTDSQYNYWVHWVAQRDSLELTANAGASVWLYSQGSVSGITRTVDLNYWIGNLGDGSRPSTAVLTPPTCIEQGKLTSTSLRDGSVIEQFIPTVDHTPGDAVEENRVPPSCTAAGSCQQVVYCTFCQEELSRTTAALPALGHDFVDGWCTRCGKQETIYDRFPDLQEGKWYSEAVEFVLASGLFSGMGDRFDVGGTMTRGMLVTVLYSLAGRPEVEGENPFTDVNPNRYYALPILWASQQGVANGTGEGLFSPEANVTREQVALMLQKYLVCQGCELPEPEGDLSGFPDAEQVHGYAADAMLWAVENGIISGSSVDGELLLLPRSNATRGQMAVMIRKFALLLQDQGLWAPAE